MHHDLVLGYLGIEVPDPTTLSPFFGDIVGLVPGEPADGGTLTWRNDDAAHRVLVQSGPANDATVVGFEAVSDEAFDTVADRVLNAGYTLDEVGDDEMKARRVDRLLRTESPWGVTIEITRGLATATTHYDSALMPGGFLTGDMGFGHVVFATTAFDDSHHFLTSALGMTQTDWLEMEIAAGIELEVRFYHCNPRHHTVALAKAPFEMPQKLHHVMFETNERDDVGAAFDRVWATDLTIANGLGRHPNDGMFSFYVVSPAGFQVEIGHGARVVTDPWTDNRRYDRISGWGHQPLTRG